MKADQLLQLGVDQIQRGRYQPRILRSAFTLEKLQGLANSIKAIGVVEPLVVCWLKGEGANATYELIAGERRWRAAQLVGVMTVPAVVKTVREDEAYAMALIENIQREDLSDYEESAAIQKLVAENDWSHQQVAERIGWTRESVTHALRVLGLAPKALELYKDGLLSRGHAKAIMGVSLPSEQEDVANKVVQSELSVRETEKLAARYARKTLAAGHTTSRREDPDVERLRRLISTQYGVDAVLRCSKAGDGELRLPFNNLEELDGILDNMKIDREAEV